MNLIKPLEVFGNKLNLVQSPSRYTGGEYGITVKPHCEKKYFNVGIAFPDLYEIAQSNLAVKIIYNGLNSYDDIRCERVYAPDCDFEKLLRNEKVPLYTLETGMPLNKLDLLSFSIGYELGITEVLAMLELGGIEMEASKRDSSSPIVIAGGCGVTNPAPLGDFFDAVFIGEAEDGLFTLVHELSLLKQKNASRSEMLKLIESKPFMWTKKQGSKISYRAVQADFGLVPSVPDYFPLSNSKPVQDHGVVEIMRGCPNGCRFCHAGIYYRPTRIKNLNLIIDEIDHLVFDAGYREVSLNSLSSADFPDVAGLLDLLNERYKGLNVSFQLPSLKVNSMSLDILEKLSTVRKSGLTFAVETPDELWQLSLNKEVYAQHLESIIKEAKARGWSSAKFYFMLGLPVGDYFEHSENEKTEEECIVDFLLEIQSRTRIQINVNVGIFIPKPHTAYQWVKQLSLEKAQKKYDYIYEHLPRGKFKIGKHNLSSTILEGLLSRGDERACGVILSAYKKGARFDAWDDHLKENMPYWQEAFDECGWDVMDYIYKDWPLEEKLPWWNVSLGPAVSFYKREWQKSIEHSLTERCKNDCKHRCGICNEKNKVEVHSIEQVNQVSPLYKVKVLPPVKDHPECNIPILYRVIFNFTRTGGAEYIAYLSQVEIFHKAILRSKLDFVFTTGFNPLPRLEFACAMTLGIPSMQETASVYLYEMCDEKTFVDSLNAVLPSNFHITQAYIFPVTNLRKRESLSSNLWGCKYSYEIFKEFDAVSFFKSQLFIDFQKKYPQSEFNFENENENEKGGENFYSFTATFPSSDKNFRLCLEEFFNVKWFELCKIIKIKTLAKDEITGWTASDEHKWRYDNKNFRKEGSDNHDNADKEETEKSPVEFFDLYKKIALVNKELIEERRITNLEIQRKNN